MKFKFTLTHLLVSISIIVFIALILIQNQKTAPVKSYNIEPSVKLEFQNLKVK